MVWEIKGVIFALKNPQLLEITAMRGKKKKEMECWEESKSTNPTDGPHQQMPFVFDDVPNYILGQTQQIFHINADDGCMIKSKCVVSDVERG